MNQRDANLFWLDLRVVVTGPAHEDEVLIPTCVSDKASIDKNPLRQVLVRSQWAPLIHSGGHTYVDLDDGRRVRLAGRTPNLAPNELALVITPDKLGKAQAAGEVLPQRRRT